MMMSKGWQSPAESEERVVVTCFACGRSLEQTRDMPRHQPDPKSDEDRCVSKPKKYSDLRCMYAIGHECAHMAKVVGTGRTFWSDADAA